MQLWLIGYSLLYIIMGLLIMYPLDFPRFTSKYWYAFLIWGAISLETTLLVQPILQNAYLNTFDLDAISSSATKLIVLIPAIAISGFFQEFLKVLPITWYRRKYPERAHASNLLSFALAVGFGFGVWEAIRLVAWPVAQLTAWLTLPVYERFITLLLHVTATALITYGILKKQGLRYYLLAATLHTLINLGATIYGLGFWGQQWIYIGGTLWAGLCWVLTDLLWRKMNKLGDGEINDAI